MSRFRASSAQGTQRSRDVRCTEGAVHAGARTALVVNPGTHPEPLALASALSRHGFAVEYMSAAQVAWSHPIARAARRLRGNGLGAREIPQEVTADFNARSPGLLLEIAYLASQRIRFIDSAALLRLRTMRVARVAAKAVARRNRDGTPFTIIVGQQTSASAAFRVGSRSMKVLMQPIVSQGWLEREMAREASRTPEWAFSVQGRVRHPSQQKSIFEEAHDADLFVAASELVASSLQEDGYGPVIVSPYGVKKISPYGVKKISTTTDSVRANALTVLFVGQVNQRKGIGYLCKAMPILRRSLAERVRLKIVGPIDPLVEETIRRELPDVEVIGALSREQVDAEYGSNDVLVLPSLAEGFALVVLEAMAHGLPCVVTDRTGAHEIISDGVDGVVVPAADPVALADGLHRVLSDAEVRNRMGIAAKVTAERYSWERFGDTIARDISERVTKWREDEDRE